MYLIKNSDGIYEPLCGLHDRNERQRTRLNASRALELLREKRRAALRSSKGVEPDAVTVTLNSQPLSCVRVDKAQKLRETHAARDWKTYGVLVHGLKSSSRTIGALDLSRVAERMEAAADRGCASVIDQEHEDMLLQYGAIATAIRELFGSARDADSGDVLEFFPQ